MATQRWPSFPLDGSGTATLTAMTLDVGSHSITANYSGDAGLNRAESGSISVSVMPARTTVSLIPHPVLKKKKVVSENLLAKINPASPGGGVPSGQRDVRAVDQEKEENHYEGPRQVGPERRQRNVDSQG